MNKGNLAHRDVESLLEHYKAKKSMSFCCSVLKDKTAGPDGKDRINDISYYNNHLFRQYMENLLAFIEDNKTNIIDAYYQGFDDCMALIDRKISGISVDALLIDND